MCIFNNVTKCGGGPGRRGLLHSEGERREPQGQRQDGTLRYGACLRIHWAVSKGFVGWLGGVIEATFPFAPYGI